MNEFLWFATLLMTLIAALIFHRILGKPGLYMVAVTSTVVCNLQVVKLIEVFGMTATLGNIVYAASFFSTDVLSEIYGKEEATRAVWLGFFSLIMMTVWMQFALWFQPSQFDQAQEHLSSIFKIMPRITIGSLSAYLLSQHHDVWAFHFWKKVTKNKHLWLRNNLSTMVSQAIDTLTFCTIAFAGVYEMRVFWSIVLSTYVLKWLVALFDTPFIYIAVRWKEKT